MIMSWFLKHYNVLSFTGTQGNFNTYNDTRSNSLNVPYDYTSVMHYSKTAFQIGSEPTIVTRIESFSDVIGQRMDFSDYDLEKLNRLYNCCKYLKIYFYFIIFKSCRTAITDLIGDC